MIESLMLFPFAHIDWAGATEMWCHWPLVP